MELFDLFICALLKLFKECINICTELPAASLMLESFEEVAGSFAETKAGFSHDVSIFSYSLASKWTGLR